MIELNLPQIIIAIGGLGTAAFFLNHGFDIIINKNNV